MTGILLIKICSVARSQFIPHVPLLTGLEAWYLMQKHWKQLSQYIETAWDYRNSILYKQTQLTVLLPTYLLL